MATKKLDIEVGVKTQQLDNAARKVGELKNLSDKISIQYDINNKPLDVVIDKSLNLKRQVVELTKALRTVKEGSAEFQVLSTALGDANDKLAASNAKSRDLLASLQLIPGPIGDFASKLNGAIGLLKTFSGFSLKDIRFQLKETINDITDIVDNIFGLAKATNEATSEIEGQTDATKESTGATEDGTAATNAGTAANLKQTDAIKQLTKEEKQKISTLAAEFNIKKQLIERDTERLNVLQKNLDFDKGKLKNDIERGKLTEAQISDEKDLLEARQKTINLDRQSVTEGKRKLFLIKEEIAERTKNSKITDAEIENLKKLSTTTQTNTTVTTTNTVAREANTVVTKAYTLATEFATFATKAFNLALASIGIGLVIALVVKAAEKLYDLGKSFFDTTQEVKDFEQAQKKAVESQQTAINTVNEVRVAFDLAEKGVISKKKALETYNEKLGNTIGQAETYNEAEKLFNSNTPAYIESVSLRAEAQELFAIAAQRAAKAAVGDDAEPTFWQNVGNALKSGGNSALFLQNSLNTVVENQVQFIKEANTLRDKGNKLLEKALTLENQFKPKADKKGGSKDKEVDDTEKANALLLKLEQENAVAILDVERKKQDKQLEIDRINEIAEVNKLKLSKDKENLRSEILLQIQEKYKLKVIELNRKRQEEDNKAFDESQQKLKEYQAKIFEIINSGNENELARNKATRTRKFEDDKAALQKDANFQKESLENKIRILLALEKAYNQDIQKLDDEDAAKKRESNLKKLDDELRFLQIRGEAVRKGTLEYFDNLRTISKKAEEREIKDLEDRAIKEKMTTEDVEREKTAIKKKYAAERRGIDQQELEAYLQYATAILGAAQNIVSNISEINQMQQDIDLQKAEGNLQKQEEIKKKYFEKNKKTQVAQAIIGTLQSAVQAYQSLAVIPIVGPALGAAAAAAALIFGYKKVNLIKQQQYQSSSEGGADTAPKPQLANYGRNYEKGGMIGGRRHAEGGTIIEAEKGEAIMTRGAVATFGPLLSLMNQAGGGVAFNSNLMTTRQDAPAVALPAQDQNTPIFKTYVVSQELTTEAQRQARLKNLSVI